MTDTPMTPATHARAEIARTPKLTWRAYVARAFVWSAIIPASLGVVAAHSVIGRFIVSDVYRLSVGGPTFVFSGMVCLVFDFVVGCFVVDFVTQHFNERK